MFFRILFKVKLLSAMAALELFLAAFHNRFPSLPNLIQCLRIIG